MKVRECMTEKVVCVAPNESASVAARLMQRHNVGTLPVRSPDGKIRGIITDRDLVLRCVAAGKDPRTASVRELMTERVIGVPPDMDAKKAAAIMSREQVRRLPVLDGGRLLGMVTLADLSRQKKLAMEAAECLSEICFNICRLDKADSADSCTEITGNTAEKSADFCKKTTDSI